MQKIITHLWFDSEAEEAAKFYTSLFEDSRILNISHYPDANQDITGKTAGTVMTVSFELNGQQYLALNGGPQFKPNESFSLMVQCEDQAEIDRLWDAFIKNGGEESQCGWLKDKWGFSWQITPTMLMNSMKSEDKDAYKRMFEAMMTMKKLDIATLEKAFKGE